DSRPDAPDGYEWVGGLFDDSVTIAAGDNEVDVTNTLDEEEGDGDTEGEIELTKTVEGFDGDLEGDFEFTVACEGYDSETVDVGAGETETFGPFDVDTECDITEDSRPDAPDGYEWVGGLFDGSETIVEGTTSVTVTNTLDEEETTTTTGGGGDNGDEVDEDAESDEVVGGIVEQPSPPVEDPPADTPPEDPPAASPASLPRTGVDSTMLAGIGLASLLAGFGLMRSGRREELA
ncbi:MAG: LPXTG cell wall anchor domain-containing protein, partial [Acidimicrobiales bacterium]